MGVEEITTLEGLRAHRAAWTALLDESHVPLIFLTPEWVIAWWTQLGRDHTVGGEKSLRTLLVWDGPSLVGVAPLMVRTVQRFGLRLRLMEFIGSGMADYGDIVLGADKPRVLHAVAQHLAERGGWDLGILEDVSGFAGLPASLQRALSSRRMRVRSTPGHPCPYVRIEGSWKTYLDDTFKRQSQASKRKRELRRLDRLLAQRGKVTYSVVRGLRDDPECFEKMADVQRDGTRSVALFDLPAYRRFLEQLARDTIDKDWLRISVLEVDGVWVAYYFGFYYGKRYSLYNTAFRKTHAECSPGRLLMVELLKRAFDEGCVEVDFMRGAEDFKFRWSNGQRVNTRLVYYPDTLRGRMTHEFYGNVWPRLRRLRSAFMHPPQEAGRIDGDDESD